MLATPCTTRINIFVDLDHGQWKLYCHLPPIRTTWRQDRWYVFCFKIIIILLWKTPVRFLRLWPVFNNTFGRWRPRWLKWVRFYLFLINMYFLYFVTICFHDGMLVSGKWKRYIYIVGILIVSLLGWSDFL